MPTSTFLTGLGHSPTWKGEGLDPMGKDISAQPMAPLAVPLLVPAVRVAAAIAVAEVEVEAVAPGLHVLMYCKGIHPCK